MHPRVSCLLLGLAACAPTASVPTIVEPTAVMICPEGKTSGPGNSCVDAPPPAHTANATSGSAEPLFRRAPTQESNKMAAFVGSWVGEDSDGSASYELNIAPDAQFTQTITTLNTASGRSPGSCFQRGNTRSEENQIIWIYEENTCNTDYEGREDPNEILEQSHRHFIISMNSYQIHYTRRH